MAEEKIYNLALKPTSVGENVDIYEYANPICEITNKAESSVAIRSIADAEMIIESLTRFVDAARDIIPKDDAKMSPEKTPKTQLAEDLRAVSEKVRTGRGWIATSELMKQAAYVIDHIEPSLDLLQQEIESGGSLGQVLDGWALFAKTGEVVAKGRSIRELMVDLTLKRAIT